MGRYAESGTESESFQEVIRNEAGSVECWKCHVKIGQGNKGQSINICIGCIGYFCNDHIQRHDNCEEGR